MTTKKPSQGPLDIKPYKGVGAVKFGMTPDEVQAVLGEPDQTQENSPMEQYHELRNGVEHIYDLKKRKLVAVHYPKDSEVHYEGADIFTTKGIVETMKEADGEPDEAGAYLNLPNLGVCLAGFGKRRIKEGKIVMVYNRTKKVMYGFMGRV